MPTMPRRAHDAQPAPPPFSIEFARDLLAECKRRGLILSVHAEQIFIADPAKVDNAPYRYTMRQAAALIGGAATKQSARTPGQIRAIVRKPPQWTRPYLGNARARR